MFKNNENRKAHAGQFFQKLEIKDHNDMADERNFFDQSMKNDQITYDNTRNIATG